MHSPEALGIVCGIVYVMSIIMSQMPFAKDSNLVSFVIAQAPRLQHSVPSQLAMYNAALLSITLILLLGFVDDVVDLKWRYKLVVPFVAAAPLVAMYTGATGIRIPQPLRPLLVSGGEATPLASALQLLGMHVYQPSGELVDMHAWYMLVVVLLVVFCTNAINIYAGVNGLEAGQALVIGAAMLFTNVFEMWQHPYSDPTWPHHFSMSLLLPFVGVTWALLYYNWYPADVFVGDTFCYFAGMTLAVSGILGNYSKTVLLFFSPQIFNFVYSMPQLFGVYPCPRHRLPKFDAATNTVSPSTFEYKGKTYANLTLICLVLRIAGPLHERALVLVLMAIQTLACAAGLWLRYALSDIVYDGM